ncbi:unnamed protein product [Meloidogyne enterolobii]|uniref:Uncharacterized protein n=1 Tax=Meloidogyne enterolobii TaxID=390850 RepID=A0ACB0ZH66_MELEN
MGQIKVHIACDINEESIKKCLELIWPKLEYQSRLVRQLELARGLKVNFKEYFLFFLSVVVVMFVVVVACCFICLLHVCLFVAL